MLPSNHACRVAVIDTNVFVGACLGTGCGVAAWSRACLRRTGVQPLMGAALLAEYEDVLARRRRCGTGCRLDAAERGELLDIFLATLRVDTRVLRLAAQPA
jgi:predicted nucleic acid-binding protein